MDGGSNLFNLHIRFDSFAVDDNIGGGNGANRSKMLYCTISFDIAVIAITIELPWVPYS